MPFTLRFDEEAAATIKNLKNGDANAKAKLKKVNRALGHLERNPRLPFVLLWWMLLAELWIGTEALLIVVTGVLAAVVVAGHGAKLSDLTFTRLRFGLFMVNVKARHR